jgi:hypothetical protein
MLGRCIQKCSLPILGEMTHQCTQLYGPGSVRVIPRNTDLTWELTRLEQIGRRVWDIPGWDRWESVGANVG